MTNNTKSIILLSGGLDSAVTLANNIEKDNIQLALFFNYGQKAYEKELLASRALCNYYNVKFEVINLDWLKNITQTSLVNTSNEIPSIKEDDLDDFNVAIETKKKVWVPNRNGLFLNIAASYADACQFDKILIGANKEEGTTFSDNSLDFISAVTKEFEFSTQQKPIVIAPLIDINKQEIIELANELHLPFNLIWSCYSDAEKHCGQCESCKRLKRGLEKANLFDIVNLLFDKI